MTSAEFLERCAALCVESPERAIALRYITPQDVIYLDEHDVDFTNVTFQLVFWVFENGNKTLWDIKEQEVVLVPKEYINDPRVRDMIIAWIIVAKEVLIHHMASDWLLPYDITTKNCPLAMEKPNSVDEFVEAFRRKSRLGRQLV